MSLPPLSKCVYHGPGGDAEVCFRQSNSIIFSAEVLRRELGIWKRLRYSNILKLMGTTRDFSRFVALVAPWVVDGNLASFLSQNNKTLGLHDPHCFVRKLRGVTAGLNYLHTFSFKHTYFNPVVHGDLTGNNVLIGSGGTAYLADFGLSGTSTHLPGMTYLAKSCHPGALRWTAPELLSEEEPASAVTAQSDIYSFGSIGDTQLTPSYFKNSARTHISSKGVDAGDLSITRCMTHLGAHPYVGADADANRGDRIVGIPTTYNMDSLRYSSSLSHLSWTEVANSSIGLQVLTGKFPWPHLVHEATILRKVVVEGEIHPRPADSNDRITGQHWNFITSCWSKTPFDRPSAEEAIQFVDSELVLYDRDNVDARQHPALVPVPGCTPPLIGPVGQSPPFASPSAGGRCALCE
ncbi:kinase-like domain-containing protein [Suillus lakei]|nr:kinase-like domain-containing protein [Suillus lakei]